MRGAHAGLLRLGLAAALTGVATGAVGAAFRHLLDLADLARGALIAGARPTSGAAVLAARWLVVRFAPLAAGSGIQHVEAVMRGEATSAPPAVVPVKFAGGLLAIGAGLALGREGPTVQMGAALGAIAAGRLDPASPDRTIVDAAGAGAGLAVAFNAPIGGMVFVFEELTRRFTPRLVLAVIVAVGAGVLVMRLLLGDTQAFEVAAVPSQPATLLPLSVVLGLVAGGIGAATNKLIMALLALSDRLARIPSLARAAAIGGLIGWVAWFRPDLVGGGDGIAQGILAGGLPLHQLAVVFLARFLIGPVSYAAGTPGGLFAPLLAVGAAAGALFAGGVGVLLPGIDASPAGFAVVGMAALFTAVVRAPVTGIVLVLEMTGRSDLGLGMIAASAAALLVTAGLGSAPIYDSLRQRMLAGMPPPAPSGQAGRGPDGIRPRQEDPGQEERGQEERGQEDRGRGDR